MVAGNKVLFGSRDSKVYILDITTGKELWKFDAGKQVGSSPAVAGKVFYILTEDGRLLAFGQ